MAEEQQQVLPRTIDNPPQVMLWSADELVPIFTCVGIGIVIDHFFIMLLIGFGAWRAFRKYRDSKPDGYMFHMLYWAGIVFSRSRILVNPFARRWHG